MLFDQPDLSQPGYRGRFAPSPTGPVHFGTLIAAVGSYLQAKKNNGDWLLRMEDVDITRKVEGADSDILNTLECFGFEWQGEVIYQSQQTPYYQEALEKLISQSLVFPCLCSRKKLATQTSVLKSTVYPGTCRHRTLPETRPHSLRVVATNMTIEFNDRVMGKQSQNIEQECGDFVIKRRDGLFAYQLAVVVDDALQGITEIVRGADLLDSTPRQIYLQRLLGYSTPAYCHLPLAVDTSGNKISKSEGAARVDPGHTRELLVNTLRFLGQKPPPELPASSLDDIWRWAIENWQIEQIPSTENIAL
jgi:glutamyl-Q tRNA(Asp) synthetase